MTTETILTPERITELFLGFSEAENAEFSDVARAIEQAVLQSPEVQRMREERNTLEIGLRELIRGYVNLLEAGRDRVIDLGGLCDPVDVMEASDPWLISARAAIAAMEQQP